MWTRNAEAIAWVTAATALFSVVFASGKFAGDVASPLQIIFLRYIGGLLTLLVLVAVSRQSLASHRSRRPLAHFLRALFGCSGGVTIMYSSANMPIVDATALGLLYVVFVMALGVLFLGERIGARHLAGIGLCCAGAVVVMISRGAFRHFDPAYLLPAAVAISGAVLLAVEGIMIKLLAQAERPLTVLLYVNTFGMLLLAIPAWATWGTDGLLENCAFMLLGPIGITAQYFVIRGYRLADLSVVGPVDYVWLIFAALIGYVFFNEIPTAAVLAGSALIAIGGMVLATLKPSPHEAVPEECEAKAA